MQAMRESILCLARLRNKVIGTLQPPRLESRCGERMYCSLSRRHSDQIEDVLCASEGPREFALVGLGKANMNDAPRRELLVTAMLPPWASMMRLQILKPRP